MKLQTFERLYRGILCANGLKQYENEPYLSRFELFLRLFAAENEKTNLTAIREPAGMIAKHFADCLLASEAIPQGASLLDVGCGGGFPTIPLAIARSDLRITAIDSTQKKIDCVEHMTRALALHNVTVRYGRVEEAKQADLRGRFDVVIARAVANLRVLTELTLPFVRVGGVFIAMKGVRGAEELSEAHESIRILGGEVERDISRALACPITESADDATQIVGFAPEERHILVIRKKKPTPGEYPRAYAAILKHPL